VERGASSGHHVSPEEIAEAQTPAFVVLGLRTPRTIAVSIFASFVVSREFRVGFDEMHAKG
jgi:xanthine/CO dehydrogenase XdhC/CoxF family maturation factor